MSEENQQEVQEQPEQETPPQQEEGESREDRRAKHDFLRFKHEARELREQNEKLMKQLEETKSSHLEQNQQFKELWEREKTKRLEVEEQNNQSKKAFFNTLKSKEIEKEAMRLGIRQEALEDLSLLSSDEVIVEATSQGNLNIVGAQEFAEKIKQTRPYWFQQKAAANVNSGQPGYQGPKSYSAAELLKLEKENPAKYREEMAKKFKR